MNFIKNLKGFTLLETMIAMSVLSIVLVSVFRLQGQSVNMINSVKFYTKAPLLARAAIERFIQELEFDEDIDSDSGTFEHSSDFTYSVEKEIIDEMGDDFPETCNFNAEYLNERFVQITARVVWEDLGLSYSFSTIEMLDTAGKEK